jgi:hypothetical protein
MKNKFVWLLIGAVVFYLVWKKFLKKPQTEVNVNIKPQVVPVETKTQGDIVNELAFARG